jgi:hypothetical protein
MQSSDGIGELEYFCSRVGVKLHLSSRIYDCHRLLGMLAWAQWDHASAAVREDEHWQRCAVDTRQRRPVRSSIAGRRPKLESL